MLRGHGRFQRRFDPEGVPCPPAPAKDSLGEANEVLVVSVDVGELDVDEQQDLGGDLRGRVGLELPGSPRGLRGARAHKSWTRGNGDGVSSPGPWSCPPARGCEW